MDLEVGQLVAVQEPVGCSRASTGCQQVPRLLLASATTEVTIRANVKPDDSSQPFAERPAFDPVEERSFVERVVERDPQALEQFARRIACVPRMLGARNRRLGRPLSDDELAEVAQDAFLVVLRRLREWQPIAPLESWIHGICCLQLADAIRGKGRRRAMLSSDPELLVDGKDAFNQLLDSSEAQHLLGILSGLESQVLRLKHFEDLTFPEIGLRLDISPNTAKTLHYRGLSKLRDMLRESPPRDQEEP